MKPFITTLAIALFATVTVFAGTGNPSKIIFPSTFISVLKEHKSLYEHTAKVCACQVLRVASNNEEENFIAVFAQGTNNGDLNANFAAAKTVVEKEKKHLQQFFYTKISTTENVTAATECSMLYKNIQVKYQAVKLYDVLDADALSNKQVGGK